MLSPGERRDFVEAVSGIVEALDGVTISDAWEAEQAGIGPLPMLAHPDVPDEMAAIYVAALEERGDEKAAAMLRAQERLAHPPLRDRAREAVARLAQRGTVAGCDAAIGTLRVKDAAILRMKGDDAMAICLLQRGSEPEVGHAVIAFVDPGTGALSEVELTDPQPHADAVRRFNIDFDGVRRHKATPAEVLELLERALRADEPLLDEMLLDLAVLERALTGEDMRLPRPPIYPLEDPEGAEAEGFAGRLVDQMVAEGVDPGDPDALAAWMEDFNARSYAERRAITGELPPAAGRAGPPKRKKQQRRQAKAARKRNRRR